jgi:alpha-tubulin suppressor-like RCC1 family protein
VSRSKRSAIFALPLVIATAIIFVMSGSPASAVVSPTSGPPAGGTSVTIEGIHFVDVAAGYEFSLGLTSAGTVYSWGYNPWGQLGDGSPVAAANVWIETPVPVLTATNQPLTGVTAITAGMNFAAALTATDVYTWGVNSSGELGTGTNPATSFATPVPALHNLGVTAISSGNYHTLALTAGGVVYGWGENSSGQLGDGTTTARSTPIVIPGLANTSMIAAGGYHNLALTPAGIKAWGGNSSGQLGYPSVSDGLNPTLVSGSLSGVTKLFAGQNSSGVITTSGAYGWGANGFGQFDGTPASALTVPTQISTLSGITSMALGGNFTLFSTALGIYSIGSNSNGALGRTIGGNSYTLSRVTGDLVGATHLSVGAYHALVLYGDGVTAWGGNSKGQLGRGGTVPSDSPVLSAHFTPGSVAFGSTSGTGFSPSGNIWTATSPAGAAGTVDVIGSANIFGGSIAAASPVVSWNAGTFTYVVASSPSSSSSSSSSGSAGSGSPSASSSSSSASTSTQLSATESTLARTGTSLMGVLGILAATVIALGVLMIPVVQVRRRKH